MNMTRVARIWVVAILVCATTSACAEERCNAAKVEAYDAWSAYALAAQAEHDRLHVICRAPRADGAAPSEMNCDLQATAYAGNAMQIESVRDRARGGAIPFRNAARAHRESSETSSRWAPSPDVLHDEPLSATFVAARERAFAAADEHWEQCSAVSP